MSPERIDPERFGFKDGRPSKPADCYALGMVIYETISGNLPYHKHADLTVFMKVVEGEHPPRGVRFTETLWKMLELCWDLQPNDRPSIEDVLQCLKMVSSPPEPPSLGVGEEMDEDGDGWDSATSSSGGDSVASYVTRDDIRPWVSKEPSNTSGQAHGVPRSPVMPPQQLPQQPTPGTSVTPASTPPATASPSTTPKMAAATLKRKARVDVFLPPPSPPSKRQTRGKRRGTGGG